MGVLIDYFRAPDAASVVAELQEADGGSPVIGADAAFDGVEAKGIEPALILAELIAAIEGTECRTDLVRETPIWPTTPPPGPEGPEDADDPWSTGPWVVELPATGRDALAGVSDAAVPAVVARWVELEELNGASAADMRPVAEELIALARRARAAGEQLYCWICV
jgi:hypothetical protein